MIRMPYQLMEDDPSTPPIGLIVLQSDETLEVELRTTLADLENPLYMSRIPSAATVSTDTLNDMRDHLKTSASLLPNAREFAVVGYGCTSASAAIGSDRIEELIKSVCKTRHVTNPLKAVCAYADYFGLRRFAFLSPYVEEVNEPIREAFADAGITTDVFGSFLEPNEANVVRIASKSIVDAASQLGGDESVDAVFMSCTNLPTLKATPEIEKRIRKPVLSSNQCLAWHLKYLSSD